MHHDVRFSTPFKAMSYAARYNAKGVRILLEEARKQSALVDADTTGKLQRFNLATLQIGFSFAGIQGYPVHCFYAVLKAQGICS